MEEKLCSGLNLERLDRIQSNIMSLGEVELTTQAVRLELAVHKLASRGFDKLAENFCWQKAKQGYVETALRTQTEIIPGT